jgi:hypothetical protein
MLLGMAVLGALVRLTLNQLGYPGLLDQTEPAVLVMATNMTVGMTLLMRHRGHSWPSIAEMAGAMYPPFIVLMLRRRREYAQDHRGRQPGQELAPTPAEDLGR